MPGIALPITVRPYTFISSQDGATAVMTERERNILCSGKKKKKLLFTPRNYRSSRSLVKRFWCLLQDLSVLEESEGKIY